MALGVYATSPLMLDEKVLCNATFQAKEISPCGMQSPNIDIRRRLHVMLAFTPDMSHIASYRSDL